MRQSTDPTVKCVYFKEHLMPLTTASYHFSKCKIKYLEENPGKQVYHCKHNFMHIFLDEASLKAHETTAVCKKDEMGQTLVKVDPLKKKQPWRSTSQSRSRSRSATGRAQPQPSTMLGKRSAKENSPPSASITQALACSGGTT